MDYGTVNAGSSETGRAFSWMLPSTEGIIKLIVDLSIILLAVTGRVEAIQQRTEFVYRDFDIESIDPTKVADH